MPDNVIEMHEYKGDFYWFLAGNAT